MRSPWLVADIVVKVPSIGCNRDDLLSFWLKPFRFCVRCSVTDGRPVKQLYTQRQDTLKEYFGKDGAI